LLEQPLHQIGQSQKIFIAIKGASVGQFYNGIHSPDVGAARQEGFELA